MMRNKGCWQFKPFDGEKEINFPELAEVIEDAIVTNQIPPGMRLPAEREMAKKFGVNHAAIHRAVQLLEQRGIVETKHGSGTYVKSLEHSVMLDTIQRFFVHTRAMPADLMSLRTLLEPYAASLAAIHATEEQVQELKEDVKQIEETFVLHEIYRRAESDLRFHETIAIASANPMLPAIMTSLHQIMLQMMTKDAMDHWVEEGVRIHWGIYEAIRDHCSELAAERMKEHMLFGRRLIEEDANHKAIKEEIRKEPARVS